MISIAATREVWRAVLASTATEPAPVPSYGWMLARTLLALLFVCVLAYVLLRWVLPRLFQSRPREGRLALLARLSLEGRRAIYVVRVLEKAYVLAATDHSIELIDELPLARAESLGKAHDLRNRPHGDDSGVSEDGPRTPAGRTPEMRSGGGEDGTGS